MSGRARHQISDTHWTGWIPQPRDHRDRFFHLEEKVLRPSELPPKGGIPASDTPPIFDQLRLGSCVPNGSVRTFLIEAIKQGLSLPMLSRLWVYAKGRDMEGSPLSEDSGMVVRDGIKVLAQLGAPPEEDWPYSDADPGPFQKEPPSSLDTLALQDRALKYQAVMVGGPGAPMRTALNNGNAIVFGFPVPTYFEDGSWDPSSGEPLRLPGPSDGYIGGHCVVARAWDFSQPFSSGPAGSFRTPPFFTIQNSWNTTWGMNGEFNMVWDWFDPWRGLASDLWIVQLVK